MALSKSRRIQILLAIDGIFFLLELVIGYAVHSLALVADSFHMLNDVLSLCVGLWAVKVAGNKTNSTVYTYGWQRAETLGALVNGVFLVALCLSIFLEAIQRFVEPQEVSHPMLVLIVGCCGLASNIVGLFLFHDHSHGGHSHGEEGGHAHSHGSKDMLGEAEEGHAHPDSDEAVTDEAGNIVDVLPQTVVASWASTKPHPQSSAQHRRSDPSKQSDNPEAISFKTGTAVPSAKNTYHQHSRSRSRGYSGLGEIPIHPASFRNEIIAAGRLEDVESISGSGTDTEVENEQAVTDTPPSEETPLLSKPKNKDGVRRSSHRRSNTNGSVHKSHRHAQPKDASGKKGGGHGHSHGDLNMRGVFLHVMGDALGNVGVIASALFIWLTSYSWRFYADPLISLIITVIILCSAIPLCKAASRILLQAVPAGMNVDDIKADITALPDVLSAHHLHVWQLSDTKLIASLHVQVAFEFKGEGSQRYMHLARQIRKCLHEYGIHSSTIQPEFCCEANHKHRVIESAAGDDAVHGEGDGDSCEGERPVTGLDGEASGRAVGPGPEGPHGCLLDCDDECGDGGKCCVPSGGDKSDEQR